MPRCAELQEKNAPIMRSKDSLTIVDCLLPAEGAEEGLSGLVGCGAGGVIFAQLGVNGLGLLRVASILVQPLILRRM